MIDHPVYALKKNYYIVNATDNDATNAKWTSTTIQTYTVPADHRWILLSSFVLLDVSSTLTIYIKDTAGAFIDYLATYSAGTGAKGYPLSSVTGGYGPYILDAGESVYVQCGTAQGAGAKASCVVLELRV